LRTNIVAAYGQIESVDLDAGEFIRGKFRKYNDIKVRLLAVVDPITKIPQPIFVRRQQSTIKGWLATNPAGAVMPWNRSRMLLTTQTDIDAAVEKYGMPLSQERTAAAANEQAANNADANNANAEVINADTQANADASFNASLEANADGSFDANLEANADHFPDGTTITDYPDVHHDPAPAEDAEDGFIIFQHDEHGAVQVTEGTEAERFFERNGVKGDPFHFMKGMKKTWKKQHGMYQDASGMLRDAILAVEQDKLDEECKKLAEHLTGQRKSRFYQKPNEAKKEAIRRMHCPGAKVLGDIERVIPKPDILLGRVKSAILFVANIRCAKSGEPLFSKESWKLYFDFVRHIKRGCVSDMPNFDYYYYTTSMSGKQKLNCVRGTSQLEGFHKHLHDMFRACHASPLLAVCLLAVFVHRWNHDRAVERGLIPERYAGFYQHEIIHEMQLVSAEFDQPHFHGDLPNPSDYGKTGETCYTPIVQQCMAVVPGGFQEEESESIQAIETEMTENMEFLAERDGLHGIPVTRMTPTEEPIFLEHLERFRRPADNNNNRHGSMDWPAMSTFWDDLAEKEWAKPIEKRRKIFRKTAHILQAHSKKLDQLENQRKTRHQLTTRRDNTTGVHSTTTVGRGAAEIRRDLHESSRELPFRTPLPEPPARKQPAAVAAEQRKAILMAPVDISRGHCNANVMASVKKRSNLRLPPQAANRAVVFQDRPAPLLAGNANERKRKKQRCYRCGRERNGAQHSRRAKQNTVEYCRAAEEQRYPMWQVPQGYNIGDPEGPGLTSMQMITGWRNYRLRKGINVDPEWGNW
jgi:hypothetical protein